MTAEPAQSAPVPFNELLEAFEFADFSSGENRAYLDPRTGRLYVVSDLDDPEDPIEEVPEDLETSKVYIALPDRRHLNLGRPLALSFVEEALPDQWETAAEIFRRKGAYGRFKALLARHGALQSWYAFQAAATERALREWCEDNGIALVAARETQHVPEN